MHNYFRKGKMIIWKDSLRTGPLCLFTFGVKDLLEPGNFRLKTQDPSSTEVSQNLVLINFVFVFFFCGDSSVLCIARKLLVSAVISAVPCCCKFCCRETIKMAVNSLWCCGGTCQVEAACTSETSQTYTHRTCETRRRCK